MSRSRTPGRAANEMSATSIPRSEGNTWSLLWLLSAVKMTRSAGAATAPAAVTVVLTRAIPRESSRSVHPVARARCLRSMTCT